ncbi:nucleotide-diphospho-sugar transferase [Tanacetum coccineum]
MDVRTLFRPRGNGIDVVVPVDSIRAIRRVSTVPVWVKLYGVPVTTFSEDGLSAIATKLGTPLMLDSYTSDMCMQSQGRVGHYTCNVCVEYEWKPPRCLSCKVFGHIHEECLKNAGAGEKKTVKKPNDDPYDDDMYEDEDLSHELQAICDNLDIRVRGRKKK